MDHGHALSSCWSYVNHALLSLHTPGSCVSPYGYARSSGPPHARVHSSSKHNLLPRNRHHDAASLKWNITKGSLPFRFGASNLSTQTDSICTMSSGQRACSITPSSPSTPVPSQASLSTKSLASPASETSASTLGWVQFDGSSSLLHPASRATTTNNTLCAAARMALSCPLPLTTSRIRLRVSIRRIVGYRG